MGVPRGVCVEKLDKPLIADGLKPKPQKKWAALGGSTSICLLEHKTSTDQAKTLAGEPGFEPGYAGIKIRCLNQLGDSPTLTCCLPLNTILLLRRQAKFYSTTG